MSSISKVNTLTIDTLVKKINIKNYEIIIKLDIEGAEMKALEGAFNLVESGSPLIIMEFSKYIFSNQSKVTFFKNFLMKFDYSIYDTNCNRINLDKIMINLDNLNRRHKTIGNLYLIKNSSNILKLFLENE